MDRISFRYLGVADVCWFLRLKRGVTRIFWKVSWLEPWIWMLLDADVFQEVTRFDCYFICANSQLGKLVCLLFLHWWMVLSLWLFVYFVPWIFLLIWVVKNHQVDWSYRSCILLLGKLYIYIYIIFSGVAKHSNCLCFTLFCIWFNLGMRKKNTSNNNHHQDYYMFVEGSLLTFACYWRGLICPPTSGGTKVLVKLWI